MNIETRFWAKVDKHGSVPDYRPDLGPCWQWIAHLQNGYGVISVAGGQRIKAHRFAYEQLVGLIPEGLYIDHLCRNRACVNPGHLEPVTNAENILRGKGAAAENARKTHCVRGHEFTPENTYLHDGFRRCRVCHRNAVRKHRSRLQQREEIAA